MTINKLSLLKKSLQNEQSITKNKYVEERKMLLRKYNIHKKEFKYILTDRVHEKNITKLKKETMNSMKEGENRHKRY